MRILIVDDEPFVLKDLEENLKKILPNCSLHSCKNATETLSYVKSNEIDVAFLDIQLPGMNGIVLAKHMKKILPMLHVVFVTGYSEYAVEAFSIHASGYLMKPVLLTDLKRELTFLYGNHIQQTEKRIQVKMFGEFRIMVDGKQLEFKRSKSKELLAFLIDKRGSGCKTRDICNALWDGQPHTKSQHSYYRTILAGLKHTLKEVDADHILVKNGRFLSIDPSALDCDSYRYEDGDVIAINEYHNDYLEEYEWNIYTVWNRDN